MKKAITVLIGLCILLFGILLLVVSIVNFITLSKNLVDLPTGMSPVFMVITNIPIIIWLLITGVGLVLRKNWSRYSLFVMSVFAIVIGIFMSLISILLPLFVDAPELDASFDFVRLIMLGIFFVFFIMLPVFFLIFFNRKSVKEIFILKEQQPVLSNRPFGITLIAWFAIMGAFFSGCYVIFPFYPKVPLVGGIFLSGIWARLYFLVLTALNAYIAIGLLKLKKAAWWLFIIFHACAILMGIINIFTISEASLIEMMPWMTSVDYQMPMSTYRISVGIGILVPALMLIYVILKRNLFLRKE